MPTVDRIRELCVRVIAARKGREFNAAILELEDAIDVAFGPEFANRIKCPGCGKPVPTAKMDARFIAKYQCPHCGNDLLVEGDQPTVEKQNKS